jgi:glycerol-3-phosphate acyltransferase PlsY
MTPTLELLLSLAVALIAYLIGSIPFAVVVSRVMGLKDPRTFGSGNPGATNVLRTGNKKAALLTLLGDALKGWVVVWAVNGPLRTATGLDVEVTCLAALGVFLGHLFPLYLKFKGGKGVATALGVLLGLQPALGLAVAATWIIVAYATRYSSLAAIMAAVFAPLYYLFGGNIAWPLEPMLALTLIIISVMLCYRHNANITRLMQGKEPKIGAGKNKAQR